MNWSAWHTKYEKSPSLTSRLRIVRAQIVAALDECAAGPVTIVSLCAGDGRDVIEALRQHKRRSDTLAWLLDTDEESLARGATSVAEAGLENHVRFVQADAGLACNYLGKVPA